MKFLHTADWQIGMRAAHVGIAGAGVREERIAASQRVIEVARQAKAEFVLLAGDTVEDNGVDRVLIQKVVDILSGFNGPVYVIPGNHDPLIPGSIWEHPAWKSASNVHVLGSPEPMEIDGGILFPCPISARHSRMDPTAWIKPDNRKVIRIGLAHGTVQGIHQEEPDYPIPVDAAARCGLDYLALGHWHSTTMYPDSTGAVRMAYSGTHEQTKFGERDSGNVLIVEIVAHGAKPIVTPVSTGKLRWLVVEEKLRAEGDLAQVRERIEALEQPESTLLSIALEGVLPAQDRDELMRLDELAASRFLFGRVDSVRVIPCPSDDNWVAGLPPGVIRHAAERLRMLSDPSWPGPRPDGATTEVAARALIELYSIASKKEA